LHVSHVYFFTIVVPQETRPVAAAGLSNLP
jgi:hypothetical protein